MLLGAALAALAAGLLLLLLRPGEVSLDRRAARLADGFASDAVFGDAAAARARVRRFGDEHPGCAVTDVLVDSTADETDEGIRSDARVTEDRLRGEGADGVGSAVIDVPDRAVVPASLMEGEEPPRFVAVVVGIRCPGAERPG